MVTRYSCLAGLTEEEAIAGTLEIFTLLASKSAQWRKIEIYYNW
jgi:hypothetical protein